MDTNMVGDAVAEVTLLERAKAQTSRNAIREATQDEVELALAYLNGEIGASAVRKVVCLKTDQAAIAWSAATVRGATSRGRLRIGDVRGNK